MRAILAFILLLSQSLNSNHAGFPMPSPTEEVGKPVSVSERVMQTLTTGEYEYISLPETTPTAELDPQFIVRHPISPGSYVTSEYGMRCDVPGVYSGCLMHSGIDWGVIGVSDWSAYPTARGTVSFVGSFNGPYNGCGNYIAIYHEDWDTTTIYCHLTSVYVGVGQYVTPQTPVGEIGTTGMSNGVHLHFMTVWGSSPWGEHYDPRHWFALHGIEP